MSLETKSRTTTFLARLLSANLAFQQANKDLERKVGLSLIQWSVLHQILDRPMISPNSLADVIGVGPAALTQTLRRLQRKKCIFVCEHPKDGRKKVLSITGHGRNALLEALPELKKCLSKMQGISA